MTAVMRTELFSRYRRRGSGEKAAHPLDMSQHPVIIQGGMGVGISDWRLAQAVSRCGQLGVVSGTALDTILVRRLQSGDPAATCGAASTHFPFRRMADRILDRYYIPGGKSPRQPYIAMPMHAKDDPRELVELCIAANFVEVTLAREGHANAVGINFLEKIQVPHLASLYGAMLAGVDYVLMGAGIPNRIPGAMDVLARHEPATYPLHVVGAEEGDDTTVRSIRGSSWRETCRRSPGRRSSRSSRRTSWPPRSSRSPTAASKGSSSKVRPPADTTHRRAGSCS